MSEEPVRGYGHDIGADGHETLVEAIIGEDGVTYFRVVVVEADEDLTSLL